MEISIPELTGDNWKEESSSVMNYVTNMSNQITGTPHKQLQTLIIFIKK